MAILLDSLGRPREVRWTATRKAAVVLRMLHGESVDEVAAATGIPTAALVIWRDRFIAAGTAGLKGTVSGSPAQPISPVTHEAVVME